MTSSVAYAYNGQYASAFTATLPTGGATSVSHNLGIYPHIKDFIIQCTTNDDGYVVGDQVSTSNGLLSADTVGWSVAIRTTPKIISATALAGGNAWFSVQPGGGGARSAINPTNWQYMFFAQRGW